MSINMFQPWAKSTAMPPPSFDSRGDAESFPCGHKSRPASVFSPRPGQTSLPIVSVAFCTSRPTPVCHKDRVSLSAVLHDRVSLSAVLHPLAGPECPSKARGVYHSFCQPKSPERVAFISEVYAHLHAGNLGTRTAVQNVIAMLRVVGELPMLPPIGQQVVYPPRWQFLQDRLRTLPAESHAYPMCKNILFKRAVNFLRDKAAARCSRWDVMRATAALSSLLTVAEGLGIQTTTGVLVQSSDFPTLVKMMLAWDEGQHVSGHFPSTRSNNLLRKPSA